MELPIDLSAIIALIFVIGFFAWSTMWEDRREERSVLDSTFEDFDEEDDEYFVSGRHSR